MCFGIYADYWAISGDVAWAASSKLKGNVTAEGRCEGEDVNE